MPWRGSDGEPVILIDRPVPHFEKSAYYAVTEGCIVNAVKDAMEYLKLWILKSYHLNSCYNMLSLSARSMTGAIIPRVRQALSSPIPLDTLGDMDLKNDINCSLLSSLKAHEQSSTCFVEAEIVYSYIRMRRSQTKHNNSYDLITYELGYKAPEFMIHGYKQFP
ncbi:hypothetical protein VNO77_39147 [Canavalia gladiata]|uniref:Uncharacterized protein n=1 Tax=Canavalia gladiata TaxID=3824 RepID=A0AAN9PVK4_CANGL